jgi:serine/threonine protein kinase
MSLQLFVIAGPDTGKAFILHAGPDLMLGRSAQAYYVLSDPRVSRNHCQIVKDGEQVSVVCNGGSGGTLVNGKKVQKHPLKIGDVLQVGDTQLRLQIGDLPLDVALAHTPATPARKPAPDPERLETLSGQTLGHFDIGPVLGRGSTSMVFHATDTKDFRPVAFKVLLPEFSKNEEEVQRFVRAMKTMLPLRHPHLVTIYAAGKTASYCWVAMEFIAGENMTQVIERIGVAGMLDWRYGFQVALQVAKALDYAHKQNILHRNVSPTNILRDAPTKTFKLGDLMLAKALEGAAAQQITKPGEIVGDIAFMAPERTRGLTEVDGRSDLYGLGATVYALLTGRPPFTGKSLVETVTRIRQTEPEKPTKYQMSIPPRFEGVVLKLLAKRPEDRYQSAAELLAELERIGKVHGITTA